MIRIAEPSDSQQLHELNREFNEVEDITPNDILESINSNDHEIVVVAEEDGILAGFVCVQIKRSFCYTDCTPEITEVYVREQYRRKRIAAEMIRFAEEHCRREFPVHKFELLTGEDNDSAKALYRNLNYRQDHEVHVNYPRMNS